MIALLGHDESGGRSGFTGFRQESSFYYLTGHDEPGAALLIAPARGKDSYHEVLFLPSRDSSATRWSGPLVSPEDAGGLGFGEVLDRSKFGEVLRRLLRDRRWLYGLVPTDPGETGSGSADRLREIARTRDIRDIRADLARMRSIKSRSEIGLLQNSVDVTVAAFRAAWAAIGVGVTERAVVAEFVGSAFRAGCRRLAFPPMAGAGANAAILHYQRNSSVMQAGHLLLMDAGVECARYAADVARTVPVGAKFGGDQRRLYELVLGALGAGIAAARPGVTLGGPGPGSLLSVVERFLREQAPSGVQTRLPHAVGHHVGLDVHDPAPVRGALREGMVIAIEPGIYLPDRELGIRVEEMVEITSDGCRVMSAGLPASIAGIERALAS